MLRKRINRKGFTLIELLIVVVIIGILALAAIPLITANTQEAKAGEAKAALGTIKDRMRVYYVQNNNALGAATIVTYIPQFAVELSGEYYASTDYSIPAAAVANPGGVELQADGSVGQSRPQVNYVFSVITGKSVGGFNVQPQ